MDIPVYVLAGGQSRRFPPDKLQLRVDGRLLPEVAAMPFGTGPRTLLVDRADRVDLPWRVVVDDVADQGPGHALLRALADAAPGWLWLIAGDMPGIPSDWLDQLMAARHPGDLAVAWRGMEPGQAERWQPIPSLWHTDARPVVEAEIQAGEASLHGLLAAVGARAVPLPPWWSALVPRLDTPGGWATWQRQRAQVDRRSRQRVVGADLWCDDDLLAVERPLQVDILRGATTWPLGVTLRTPGDDAHLALGLAVAEGIVRSRADVAAWAVEGDVAHVMLQDNVPDPEQFQERLRPAVAACGACGKADIDLTPAALVAHVVAPPVDVALLQALPDRLRAAQPGFAQTGAMHAAGLFDAAGQLLHLAEDVGRHNALDKLVGHALLTGSLPLTGHIVVLSGRVAFELVQKAARAGVAILVAVGAPSTLAVDVAHAAGITLVGFARPGRCNIYTHAARVSVPTA